MEWILVGIGGAFGGLLRFQLGKIISRRSKSKIPIGTLIINVTGAVLLGIVTSFNTTKNIYLLLGDGFLGAYTTFSTFMFEGFNLFHENKIENAITYIAGTFIIGVVGYLVGFELCNLF